MLRFAQHDGVVTLSEAKGREVECDIKPTVTVD
jgi:hypothetical protein